MPGFQLEKLALLSNLKRCREVPMWADLTFIARDKERVLCHGVVAASNSIYLRDQLCSTTMVQRMEMKAKIGTLYSITLDMLSQHALVKVVKFFYTGRIKITDEDIHQIIVAANFIQSAYLMKDCLTYIRASLCMSNYRRYFRFGRKNKIDALVDLCHDFLSEKFTDFVQSLELLTMEPQLLALVLKRDENAEDTEDATLYKVLSWIKSNSKHYNEDQLYKIKQEVMDCMRFKNKSSECFVGNLVCYSDGGYELQLLMNGGTASTIRCAKAKGNTLRRKNGKV